MTIFDLGQQLREKQLRLKLIPKELVNVVTNEDIVDSYQTDSRHPLLILLLPVATNSRLMDGSDGSTSQFLSPATPALLQ